MNFYKLTVLHCLGLFSALSIMACNPMTPLPGNVDEKIAAFTQTLASHCFENNPADVNDNLVEFKGILDDIYQGQPTPLSTKESLNQIYDGYALESYPTSDGNAGGIVARPIAAGLHKFLVALTWPDMMEVYTNRYISYTRQYLEGGDPVKFVLNDGTEDILTYTNHVVDIGQQEVSFEYDVNTVFTMHRGEQFPKEGVLVDCSYMPAEAVYVAGPHNPWMKTMYTVLIYYPIDADNTYRIAFTWIKAGGSEWIFGANANSGNVGKGIVDEFVGITNFVLDPLHF